MPRPAAITEGNTSMPRALPATSREPPTEAYRRSKVVLTPASSSRLRWLAAVSDELVVTLELVLHPPSMAPPATVEERAMRNSRLCMAYSIHERNLRRFSRTDFYLRKTQGHMQPIGAGPLLRGCVIPSLDQNQALSCCVHSGKIIRFFLLRFIVCLGLTIPVSSCSCLQFPFWRCGKPCR